MGLVGAPGYFVFALGNLDLSYSVGPLLLCFQAICVSLQSRSHSWIAFKRGCYALLPLIALAHLVEFHSILIFFTSWRNKSQSEMLFLGKKVLSKRRLCIWGTVYYFSPISCIQEWEKQLLGCFLKDWFPLSQTPCPLLYIFFLPSLWSQDPD